jgi:hypothetical protein
MTVESPEVREAHTCDKCGITDAHTKHIVYASGKHPITGADLDFSIEKHIQCCAADGCEVCSTDVEFLTAEGIAPSIGDAFTEAMKAKSTQHLAALGDRHGISTQPAEGEEPSVRS